jgi:hypothetical protein
VQNCTPGRTEEEQRSFTEQPATRFSRKALALHEARTFDSVLSLHCINFSDSSGNDCALRGNAYL